MRRVATIRLALVAIVFGLVALAATLDHPAGSLAASRLAGIAGAGTSGIQLVNLSENDSATFGVDLYNQAGHAAVHVAPPPVAPGVATTSTCRPWRVYRVVPPSRP